MKIAYVGNFTQQHCTEVHLAATLEDLGHQVVRLQEDRLNPGWADYVIANELPDMFLFTRTWGKTVTLNDLQAFKNNGIPTVSYHLDLYVGLQREDGLDNDPFWRTDFVFTPDGSEDAARVFSSKGINHHYVKPGVFKPECYLDEERGGGAEVLFVGGGSATGEGPQYGHKEWPYRGQLIKFLQDTYGNRFIKKGWPHETVRNHELNRLYSDSKVVVGDSLCLNFDRPYYWSDRVCETLGRGGFMIHPYIKGMEEEFTDGEHIVYYKFGDFDELKQKIDYYLEHVEERERIRKAGHERVKQVATYHNRMTQMLDTVFPPSSIVEHNRKHGLYPDHPVKISLGAGEELETEPGWVNLDIVDLPGIDVVHNLLNYPWPFADGCAEFIKAKDVIEHMPSHLPDGQNGVIAFIEEAHRILKPGGKLWIQTPGWDADFLWIDPTHVRGFDVRSMDFFDPDTDFGRSTGFYSKCKFKVTATKSENKNVTFEMIKL